ncbi:unnamed protein product [Gordionus sp. m RMFG-2023]
MNIVLDLQSYRLNDSRFCPLKPIPDNAKANESIISEKILKQDCLDSFNNCRENISVMVDPTLSANLAKQCKSTLSSEELNPSLNIPLLIHNETLNDSSTSEGYGTEEENEMPAEGNRMLNNKFEYLFNVLPYKRIPIKAPLTDKTLTDPSILKNLLIAQDLYKVPRDYFSGQDKQDEINIGMRKILITWMYQVCEECKYKIEVFLFAVNLLDRFLCKINIRKSYYQLLGGVALFISSKFKEVCPMSASVISAYTDNLYTAEEIIEWELFFVNVLEWELGYINHISFLDSIFSTLEVLPGQELSRLRDNTTQFIILCVLGGEYMFTKPSDLVGACIYLSFYYFEKSSPNYVIFPQIFSHIKCLLSIEDTQYHDIINRVHVTFQDYLKKSDPNHFLIRDDLKFR